MTREHWLIEALAIARSELFGKVDDLPELADNIKITCGWPSKGGLSAKKRVVGQCFSLEASSGGFSELFISPYLDRPIEVVETVLHEAIHAAVGVEEKHRGLFIKAAKAIGFTKPWTQTPATPQLSELIQTKFLPRLGDYPHKKLDVVSVKTSGPKPDHNRMLKLTCGKCGYLIRTAKKWLQTGLPTCSCGEKFSPEEEKSE